MIAFPGIDVYLLRVLLRNLVLFTGIQPPSGAVWPLNPINPGKRGSGRQHGKPPGRLHTRSHALPPTLPEPGGPRSIAGGPACSDPGLFLIVGRLLPVRCSPLDEIV